MCIHSQRKFSRHRVYTDFSNPVVKHDIQDKKKKRKKERIEKIVEPSREAITYTQLESWNDKRDNGAKSPPSRYKITTVKICPRC